LLLYFYLAKCLSGVLYNAQYKVFGISAFLTGLAKTSVGGLGIIIVPFSASLGLITAKSLKLDLFAVPVIITVGIYTATGVFRI